MNVGAPHSPLKTGVDALVAGARRTREGGHKGRPYDNKTAYNEPTIGASP